MGVIPSNIIVGFQEREDTYTGRLGYVCYLTGANQDIVKQKKSFDGWIDEEIPTEKFENTPTSGFVLNRSAGGNRWGWNGRTIKARVYDPRGFEFEIDMENLLYILENTNAYKGKALDGEFVYAWMGSGSVSLIPVDSPAYKDHYSNIETMKKLKSQTAIPKKELVVGKFYRNTKNQICRYFGAKGDLMFDQFEVYSKCGSYYIKQTDRLLAKTMVEELDHLPTFDASFGSNRDKMLEIFNFVDKTTFLEDTIDVTLTVDFSGTWVDYLMKTVKINGDVLEFKKLNQKTVMEKINIHPKMLEVLKMFPKDYEEFVFDYLDVFDLKELFNPDKLEMGDFELRTFNLIYIKKYDIYLCHYFSFFSFDENGNPKTLEEIRIRHFNGISNRAGWGSFECVSSQSGYDTFTYTRNITKRENFECSGTYRNIYYCEI